jgi:hypothetical protein
MKHFRISFLFLLFSSKLLSQNNDPWFTFWNKDTTLIGFKDKNGVVKIEPKFTGLTNFGQFDHIIAVTEEKNGSWDNYYLTKSGKIIGRDSFFVFDNTPDCEHEGFIRFRDPITDKVGLFNKKGELVVPAMYNFTTPSINGMIVALTGATKNQMGEHYSWAGGQFLLVDTNNNMLIDNFGTDKHLNLYSLLVTPQPHKDSLRHNYKGVNGQYYSFIDYDKEFLSWVQSSLLTHFTKTSLLKSCNKEIFGWRKPAGWTATDKNRFIDRNFETVKKILLALNSPKYDYQVFNEGLNPFIYESVEYKKYFDNCGQSKDARYPVKSIVISYNNGKKGLKQDHFDFLRTDDGYKLISLQLNSAKLQ